MKFPVWVAKRYLFSKKSHNTINVISGISAAGVAVGTLALVCVMSVFNGFETLIESMFSAFDPDLRVSLVEGKTFDVSSPEFQQIRKMKSIVNFTEVIEENALLRFRDKQMPATIKGVSNDFRAMTRIDSIMFDGEFVLTDSLINKAVAGVGVATELGMNSTLFDPLVIYAPKRTERINILRPENSFNSTDAYVSGIFIVNQAEYDNKYVFLSVETARGLFGYDKNKVSKIELKINPSENQLKVQNEIKNILGKKFKVQNRYEQQESFFKIMKIEKWITYLILCFILLIAVFNIIGSLSMLIIDKRDDIQTLRNLGADNLLIKRIFVFEGWFISAVGAVAGIILGTAICLLQEHLGLLKMGEGYVVDAYPVATHFFDILLVLATVLIMGLFASLYPVKYINSLKEPD
ncbi:MAG TPA: ABC transporter permease [Paludibacteraceae bacterium]|nr:ABC transporter permease [Paludibacteraceae bacterium]